jgi:hypothetical protein
MALPTGVNKANGLREALRTLRLSAHNAIGIGDVKTITTCSRCVNSASPSPGEAAPSNRPQTRFCKVTDRRRLEGTSDKWRAAARLAPDRVGRRRLIVGNNGQGGAVSFAVRGRNLLVAGDPKSGKSWVAGLVCERRRPPLAFPAATRLSRCHLGLCRRLAPDSGSRRACHGSGGPGA